MASVLVFTTIAGGFVIVLSVTWVLFRLAGYGLAPRESEPGGFSLARYEPMTRLLSEADFDFLAAQPGATFCHRYAWRSVIESVFGHECRFLAARSNGALVAVLPLVRVKSHIFGHYLVSMPFLNYGGPLGSEEGVHS